MPSIDSLSDQEMQVMLRLCDGKKAARIAEELHIAASTVQTHLDRVKRKLKANNVLHAALIFDRVCPLEKRLYVPA